MSSDIAGDTGKFSLTPPNTVDDCLESVVTWLEKRAGKNYFVNPLEDFQAKFGKVNPEDDFYQARMNYFLEHCVLERPMSGLAAAGSPLSVFFAENSGLTQGDDAASEIWRNFCGFRHSLFQVIVTGDHSITIRDLIADRSIQTRSKSGETLKYLRKGSIFQGFIFGHHGQYVLGQGLIIHPELANKEILKFLKQHRKFPRFAPSEIARMMAMTNMRFLRMQHVNPAVIYHSVSG